MSTAKQLATEIKALRHWDVGVRRDAAQNLGQLSWTPSSQADFAAMHLAAQRWSDLERMPLSDKLAELTRSLSDLDCEVRKQAAAILSAAGWSPSNGSERALFLIAAQRFDEAAKLADSEAYLLASTADPQVRDAVRQELLTLPEKPISVFIRALGDDNADVRRTAADLLVVAGEAAVPHLLEQFTAVGDPYRARLAAFILGRINSPEVLLSLVREADQIDEIIARHGRESEMGRLLAPAYDAAVLAAASTASSDLSQITSLLESESGPVITLIAVLETLADEPALAALRSHAEEMKAAKKAWHTERRFWSPDSARFVTVAQENIAQRFAAAEQDAFEAVPAATLKSVPTVTEYGLGCLTGLLAAVVGFAVMMLFGLWVNTFFDPPLEAGLIGGFVGLIMVGFAGFTARETRLALGRRRSAKLRPARQSLL